MQWNILYKYAKLKSFSIDSSTKSNNTMLIAVS